MVLAPPLALLLAALVWAPPGAAQQDPAGRIAPAAVGGRFDELMRGGRYADALRVSQLARAPDVRAGRDGAALSERSLHMTIVAASYDGQSEVAIRAARELAGASPRFAYLLPLVFARFGQWEEIIRLPVPRGGFQRGMLAYAWGLATLRIDGPDDALLHLTALDIDLMGTGDPRERALMETARAILAAEIQADVGEYDAAIATLEEALALEDGRAAHAEPDDWIVPARQVLGAILLEVGRAEEAERAYRGELEVHPENGWSLYGLALALRAQGEAEDAAATLARYDRAWARADVGLRGSRF